MKKIYTIFSAIFVILFGVVFLTPGIYANPVNGQAEDIDGTIHNFMGGYEYLITEDLPGGQTLTPQEETYYGLYWADHFDSPQYNYNPWLGRTDEGLTVRNVEFGNEFGEIAFKGTINKDYYVRFTAQKKFTVSSFSDGVVFTSTSSRLYLRTLSFDGLRPALSGQENFAVSVDDPKPVSYFQSFLTAIDETDGDITDSIYLINDNYTTNQHVKGTYDIEFGVSDAAGNISTLIVKVTVGDVTKPVITGNSSKVQISYTQTWNVNTFKSTLVASDNYDTMTNADIVIESDGYTSKKTTLGTYNVVFSLTDSSGNKTTFTKQIEVIDDIAPTWTGPTSINKPSTSILTVNDIRSQLTATDEKEGNVNASIKVVTDNYTGNGSKVGTYTIIFEASDSKGNKSTRTVSVIVQDNLPPVWYIQDGVTIKLVPPTVLTQQQIVDLIIATGQLNINSQTQVMFKVDNYTGNENTPGVYLMTLAYSDTNGNEGEHEVSITVLESEDDGITLDPKEKSILEHLNEFWNSTVEFYETSKTWVVENPWMAGGIAVVVLVLIATPFIILSNKNKY